MAVHQISSQKSDLLDFLAQHGSLRGELSDDEREWVINNPKAAILLFVKAIKNRDFKAPEIEKPKILEFVNRTTVCCLVDEFVVRERFAQGGPVKFYGFGDNFKNWFGDKIEKRTGDTSTLRYHKLLEHSVDGPIIAELGGEEKAETSLTEIYLLLLNQKNGEKGSLLTNGSANIFYVRDVKGILRAVHVFWCVGGWYVNARSVSDPYAWSAGRRVFSRDS